MTIGTRLRIAGCSTTAPVGHFLCLRRPLETLCLTDKILSTGDFAQEPSQSIKGIVRLRICCGITERNIHLVDLRLSEMIICFSHHGMEEIDHTKGSRHKRENVMPLKVDLGGSTRMGKHVVETHLAQCQLNIVGVCSEILQRVQSLT